MTGNILGSLTSSRFGAILTTGPAVFYRQYHRPYFVSGINTGLPYFLWKSCSLFWLSPVRIIREQ